VRRIGTFAAALVLTASLAAAAQPDIVWRDNDDMPIAEPAEDPEGDYIWWDGVSNMLLDPLGGIFDLGRLGRSIGQVLHVVGPREAANVNALDEVPDSTWFTNRHARRRLTPAEIAIGPGDGHAPAADGPLVILSGKALGMTPGFVVQDAKKDRYVVKVDPPEYPEVATGAEMVCSKILWALGWNVPEYYPLDFPVERLTIDAQATAKDEYGNKVPFTRELLDALLTRAYKLPDGRVHALASRFIAGTPKGSPRMLGTRPDDPNDTVLHQDRRDLRGLRVVAAFINFTDSRRGNFYDSFVRHAESPNSGGHVVHYVLDFSSALGAGNVDWKDPKLGNEYLFDPPKVALRVLTLGLVKPAWVSLRLTHPALGYFESSIFDPEAWKPSYRNPAFAQATRRDAFWGAKLVTSLRDEDLRGAVHTGGWSDPKAESMLTDILIERRRRIARAYFHWLHVNPADRFTVRGATLEFEDLTVANGVIDASAARYRYRSDDAWTTVEAPRMPAPSAGRTIELQTSHDRGERWSPTTRVRFASPADPGDAIQAAEIERFTR